MGNLSYSCNRLRLRIYVLHLRINYGSAWVLRQLKTCMYDYQPFLKVNENNDEDKCQGERKKFI